MLPLADIRIVAVEQFGAGPFGSMQLADLGADVIKVEDPATGGDVSRTVPPFAEDGDSLFFESLNRNKRSVAIDLSNPAGRSVFEDLVRVSDVVYCNLRGDVPAKLRLRYDDLAGVNPKVVCCSLSAYGTDGPRAAEPGYDYILQGLAGWMHLTGEPGGPPTKSGLSMVDLAGGLVGAISILAGVHAARRDGVGCDCDLSLFDTALSMVTYPAVWHLNRGFEPVRMHHSAHPSLIPFQAFATADGWIVVACAKEKFWVRLCDVLGRPTWVTDARYSNFAARDAHRGDIVGLLEAAFVERTSGEWLTLLGAAGVPCGPVNDVAEALAEPQASARGMVIETDHPRFGVIRQVASAVRVGDSAATAIHRRGPRLAEDAGTVFGGLLGYEPTRLDELTAAGAFGSPGTYAVAHDTRELGGPG